MSKIKIMVVYSFIFKVFGQTHQEQDHILEDPFLVWIFLAGLSGYLTIADVKDNPQHIITDIHITSPFSFP